MARVLVIDDDVGTLLGYRDVLRAAGHDVATAALGEDGIVAAQRGGYGVVLCDLRLADMSGLEVVRQIHQSCPDTSVVLVTGWGTQESEIEARRLGATSQMSKPLIGDDLVRVVEDAARLRRGRHEASALVGYAARRWAELIVRGQSLDEDPTTISTWSHAIAVAPGTLKKRCQAVGVTPKASLDLVRLLRIVTRHPGEPWDLQRRLDIVDDRTAGALLERSGFCFDCPRIPALGSFLSDQRLIARPELVEALREQLLPVRPQ